MIKPRVLLVRHGDDPSDDRVHTYLIESGLAPEIRKPFAGEALAEPDEDLAGAAIYGGPFAVCETDRFPFLLDEYRFVDSCLTRDVPLLGICQGAQQIAHHLGAKVGPVAGDLTEFGYYRIDPADGAGDFLPGPITVTQAHFHTFGIPEGAVRLAGSALFPNQAFRYGDKAYALQFHSEVTIEGFRRWQRASWALFGKPGAQTKAEQDALMHAHDAAQADWFCGFLGRLFGAERA